MHIIDVALDINYIKDTPMENDEYYIILICFIILPVFLVIFIAIIETIRYEKHIDGFIMFTLGGLTNTTHLILEHYY